MSDRMLLRVILTHQIRLDQDLFVWQKIEVNGIQTISERMIQCLRRISLTTFDGYFFHHSTPCFKIATLLFIPAVKQIK